jgi:hypothetical protein
LNFSITYFKQTPANTAPERTMNSMVPLFKSIIYLFNELLKKLNFSITYFKQTPTPATPATPANTSNTAPERTMNSMVTLFKSQFNLDLALPEHILWIVYQFARESKAYEEILMIERLALQLALSLSRIPDKFEKKILKINPRLKEMEYCCSIIANDTHEYEDEHYTRDMFAAEIIRKPKYPLLRIFYNMSKHKKPDCLYENDLYNKINDISAGTIDSRLFLVVRPGWSSKNIMNKQSIYHGTLRFILELKNI